MNGSMIDLIVSMFQNPQVPMRSQERLGPVSFANDDVESVPGNDATARAAEALYQRYRNPEDEAMAAQFGHNGAEFGSDIATTTVPQSISGDANLDWALKRQKKASEIFHGKKYGGRE